MKTKGFSIREAISFGWEEMKKNFMFFLGFLIILFVAEIVINWFFARTNFNATAQIGMTISLILSILIGFAVTKISLDAANNESLSLKNINKVLPRFLDYFLVQILTSLIVSVGFVLLIVPGIIWSIQFSMAPYLIIEKKLNPIEAMRESSRITKGNKWRLFIFSLLLALINIAGILVFIVGIFSTLPTAIIAHASIYNKLKTKE